MRMRKLMSATTALSMVAAPVAAAPANPAARLSLVGTAVQADPQGQSVSRKSHGWLIAALLLVGVVAVAVALGGDHDSKSASS